MGVGQMALLDASSDMLNVAREKLAAELDANKVSSIVQNSLPEIPFGDGTFDGVLLNAVLPHLPRGDGNFSGAVETLKEARRVLQPDGVISITESLDSSLTNAWCLNISPEIANKFCPILPSVEEWNKIFYEAGLKCLVRTNLLGFGLFSDEDYFDDTNIFKQEWLNSSVYYEPATKEEIERMRQKVKTLQTRGEIKEWIKDHDQTEKFGFMTLFICQ
ncbi:uncharacterized protein LOC128237332 isoform X2 [Mya arenaria]|nr:uncharacterized protein LOC128237332 isoform X2 [Mya arenaria]